jgi:hypothetical protein
MNDFFEPVTKLWKVLSKGRIALPTVAPIAPANCKPAGEAGYEIRRKDMYFTMRINEMYLAENRQWWSVYDPLVVVVCEFNYGQERVAVPTVIGPNLIQKKGSGDKPKHGVVLLDTRVTGPHPYSGGDLDVSVALYQVQRANYAQILLKVIDTLSNALGDPGQMQAIAKTGTALLEGVEGLLGMSETTYLAGLRAAMVKSPVEPLLAQYCALITPKAPEISDLSVIRGRLHVKSNGSTESYRRSDFVLLSIMGSETRGDETNLPFFQLKTDALAALWDGKGGTERAKSNLIAAYQQMRKSPDMTELETGRLFDSWLAEFKVELDRVARTRAMPVQQHARAVSALAKDLNDATLRIDQLPWPPPNGNGPDH